MVFIGGRDIHVLGGIESYMLNLATQLVRMGHEPVVFCESDHDGEEVVNGFRVIHQRSPKSVFLCKPWLGLKATLFTIRHIKDADFIHYNAWPPSLSSPLARIYGIPSLMQGHGLEWQRSKYSHKQQLIMRFMEWLTAHLNRNLIMCSADQCRYFKEHYNRESVVIPTAIYMPDYTKKDTAILSRFEIEKGKYILFLARFVKEKNPHYLIRAFNRAKLNGLKLVMAGDNIADPAFVAHLHELGKDNSDVVFTGAVYGDDKEMLLRNAKAFCVPSTIEGLSISLLEGMGYGLPIVASTIPANREVLEEERAFWCEPEDEESLAKALTDLAAAEDATLKAMTEYNKKKIEDNYTWERVAEKYVCFLQGEVFRD